MDEAQKKPGSSRDRAFIFSVALAGFASQPPFILIGLVLIDIGLTFGYPVGITSQLRTSSAVISVVVA